MTSNAQNSFVATEQFTDASQRTEVASIGNHDQPDVDQKNAEKLTQLLRNKSLKNWDSSNVDLQLAPASCIDIYRELVIQKKTLQLLPDKTANDQPTDIMVNQLGKLATKHPDGKLALRCRKIEMETSGNNTVQYTLYMAAGFAVTTTQDGSKQRVPVLLIPITVARLRGRGSAYGVSYTGEALRLNPNIAESCDAHVDQLVKPFEKASDLRDYLRGMSRKLHKNLQCRISANTGIFSLQADVLNDITANDQTNIELDRTRPGMDFKPLPPTPESFNAQLAIRMLRFINQDQLTNALEMFSGAPTHSQADSVLNYDLDIEAEKHAKTMKCAQWLCEVGLGHWQLTSLAQLPHRIKQLSNDLKAVCEQPSFTRHIRHEHQTIGMIQSLYRAQNRIGNAPPEMQHHAISLHADPDTRLLLQKAKIQAASIEHEMATFQETFHMSAVPNSTALHQLIKVIAKREQSSQLTNPQYFRARRQLNEILKTHNGLVTDNDLIRLEALAKTLKFAELFEEDPYYRRCFGSLFHGVSTNWQRLDSVVDFARSLSYDLDSHELVGKLTEQWPSFQRDFGELQPTLRPAATSAHKLCSLIPLFINQNTALDHAVSTTDKFHDKVYTWQNYLRKYVADTSLTPYGILRSEQHESIDSAQEIAFSENEYDDRIYHHIVGVGLPAESVAATAEWLINSVDRLNIDLPTVRRYLDSESQFEGRPTSRGL